MHGHGVATSIPLCRHATCRYSSFIRVYHRSEPFGKAVLKLRSPGHHEEDGGRRCPESIVWQNTAHTACQTQVW